MAATALIGRADEFDGEREEWTQYIERLKFFFQANGITDADKKRAVFLSVVGPASYKLLRNLISPARPDEKTFEELVEVLQNHYSPKPSETLQRYRFKQRSRKPGETVAAFVADLRSIAEYCNFGASLEESLRDQIVCGINDSSIQQKLFAEKNLTYKRALELSRGLEAAAKNVKELKTGKPEEEVTVKKEEVHKISRQKKKPPAAATIHATDVELQVISHRNASSKTLYVTSAKRKVT